LDIPYFFHFWSLTNGCLKRFFPQLFTPFVKQAQVAKLAWYSGLCDCLALTLNEHRTDKGPTGFDWSKHLYRRDSGIAFCETRNVQFQWAHRLSRRITAPNPRVSESIPVLAG